MTKEEKEQKILSLAAQIRARNMWKKKIKEDKEAGKKRAQLMNKARWGEKVNKNGAK